MSIPDKTEINSLLSGMNDKHELPIIMKTYRVMFLIMYSLDRYKSSYKVYMNEKQC